MLTYIIRCKTCGKILEEDCWEDEICFDCNDKELKDVNFAKRNRIFKRTDTKKMTHRTKKRQTKPRKEVQNKDV